MRLQPEEFADLETKAELFAPCKGRHVFLVGGTGFVGRWMMESFLHVNKVFDLNARLTVLSRDPQTFLSRHLWLHEESALTFVQGDVRDFAFPSRDCEFVIHAATSASTRLEHEDPEETSSVIVEGTRHVLDFAQRGSVARLLLISSGAVYGPQPSTVRHIPETLEGTPTTAYGRGKKVSEQLSLDASSGQFGCVIARPFSFVGPYLPLEAHFAVGNFIRDALAGQSIIIKGNGRPLRSYLYAADLAVWLWTILLSGQDRVAYNVGSSEAVSIAQLARLVSDASNTHLDIVVQGVPDEGVPVPQYVPDTHLAENSLGLQVLTPLTTAIRRTLDFHRRKAIWRESVERMT